jgi:hypothetical protein
MLQATPAAVERNRRLTNARIDSTEGVIGAKGPRPVVDGGLSIRIISIQQDNSKG